MLINAEGEEIDRWRGYDTPGDFIATLEEAKSDPTSIEEKIARFEASPAAADAARLARIHQAREIPATAVRYYREAERLDPERQYPVEIFVATYGGLKTDLFTVPEVREAADRVLASNQADAEDLVSMTERMGRLAATRGDLDLLTPYLGRALEASEDIEDPGVQKGRARLLILEALHVAGDKEKAVALKRESMPESWQDDAGRLNEFAWWCFENRVNLEEAESLGRKGVQLAEPGSERAMILDTVAEICNVRGECGEAVELIRQAIAEDPDSEHYPEQLARFQDLLAKQG